MNQNNVNLSNYKTVSYYNKTYFKSHLLYKPPLPIIKQERWRRKQIHTLYETGRPLFGSYTELHRPL